MGALISVKKALPTLPQLGLYRGVWRGNMMSMFQVCGCVSEDWEWNGYEWLWDVGITVFWIFCDGGD